MTPFAAEERSVYDGKGHFSSVETHASNGNITFPVSPSGTYTVNPDCTGTFFVGGTSILNFVIDQDGTHIRAISTTPGLALTIEYSEQFPENQNSQ
ncbi:MAG TPA: hypothetical protein VGR45_02910 [Stellaceae bacterium]|nr:hypothetical protein [Stellaceae bacterium]